MNEKTLDHLSRINRLITLDEMPFYIEHNDYVSAGIGVREEVGDMIMKDEIDAIEGQTCIELKSVWSARFSYSEGFYTVVYAATFEKVISKICHLLEEHFHAQ